MIQMLTSVIGQRGVDAMAFLLAFALTALTDSIFRDKLPHDHGRAFAVNGELSKGKARGSGLIFVLCIALVSLAFLPFNTEYVVYNVLLIASMLSGYLDDAAETAWNEYKKGIIDFVIAVLAGVIYTCRNRRYLWMTVAYAFAFVVYVIDVSTDGVVKQVLSGFWYTDYYRTGAMTALFAIPLDGLHEFCRALVFFNHLLHLKS